MGPRGFKSTSTSSGEAPTKVGSGMRNQIRKPDQTFERGTKRPKQGTRKQQTRKREKTAIERKKEGKYYCVTQTCQKVRPGSVAESLRRRLSKQNPQGRVQRVPRKGRRQFCVPGVLCKVRSSVALVARLRD